MSIRPRLAALALAALAASAAHAGSPPADVTGTWEATVSCKGLNPDGTKFKASTAFLVQNAQVGSNVFGQITLPLLATGARGISGNIAPICGRVVADPAKPGKGRLNYSATGAAFSVILQGFPAFPGGMDLSFSVGAENAKGISGSAKGPALFDSVPSLVLGGGLGSCKVKMSRVSTETPINDSMVDDICQTVFDSTL